MSFPYASVFVAQPCPQPEYPVDICLEQAPTEVFRISLSQFPVGCLLEGVRQKHPPTQESRNEISINHAIIQKLNIKQGNAGEPEKSLS
jgi:hypothetical protein